jgi:hypothetical protein
VGKNVASCGENVANRESVPVCGGQWAVQSVELMGISGRWAVQLGTRNSEPGISPFQSENAKFFNANFSEWREFSRTR